jgi:hypothetical protein
VGVSGGVSWLGALTACGGWGKQAVQYDDDRVPRAHVRTPWHAGRPEMAPFLPHARGVPAAWVQTMLFRTKRCFAVYEAIACVRSENVYLVAFVPDAPTAERPATCLSR